MTHRTIRLPLAALAMMLATLHSPVLATASQTGDPTPSWAAPVQAPASAPNIVLIMLDDVGFADTGTFGGPAATPFLDRVAANGLRYNRFHTTALCSPSRAALLTGRNAHQVGTGSVGEIGFPGYNGIWGKDAVSFAEVLRRNGYGTAVFGKWHNTPFREISPTGPFDRWPTSQGFEYFYGNMLGATSQWEPILWRNTLPVQQPKSREQGYHFTSDMVDDAIRWINAQKSLAPAKPYMVYFSTAAAHMPHDVPQEWIERYKGKFDQGWDVLRQESFARQKSLGVIPADAKLTPRPDELPAWDSIPEKQRSVLAKQMEAYAAFISHTDAEIGRFLDAARAAPGGDNLLVIYIVGDNGSAGEMDTKQAYGMGMLGPDQRTAFYAAGWAWAGSTPFAWSKGVASHLGGTRNPMVVSWPGHIEHPEIVRNQFTHLNDIAATIYDVTGIKFPAVIDGVKQKPLEGASFSASFKQPAVPSRHRTQYFEIWGNRAIYHDGWLAAARHSVPWQMKGYDAPLDPQSAFAADRWELYNLDEDFSQATDLASRYPARLKSLERLFGKEAKRNGVLPFISNNMYGAYPPAPNKPQTYVFREGMPTFLALSGPEMNGRSFRIEAEVDIPANGAEGVLFAQGGAFSIYMKDGAILAKGIPLPNTKILKAGPIGPGKHRISYSFTINPGPKPGAYMPVAGTGRLTIDDHIADEGKMGFLYSSMQEVDVGRDTASPASKDYLAPFPFTGRLIELRLSSGAASQ